MFLILVLISSALVVCLGLLLRMSYKQCAICGKKVSPHAITCSAKCRQVRHREARSHQRDKVVTPVFSKENMPVTGRGEEPNIYIDGRKVG
jgi:predicted nucleic acid-binding Zn ribbon protein